MLQLVMHRLRFLVILFPLALGLALWAGCRTQPNPASITLATTNLPALKPGPNDARIAFVAARMMEAYHYYQRPLDREMSAKFFDSYIDALDPRHELFLQTDLAEWTSVRTNLDILTVGGRGTAELGPAFAIYERFRERSIQRANYVQELLATEKFKFTTNERFALDRREAPFPQNIEEARQLWKQRVRWEYLQEKLGKSLRETNGTIVVNPPPGMVTNILAALEKRNRQMLRLMTNWDSDKVLQAYLNFGLAHAYDPHSDYFGAPKAQDFSIDMNLALIGIGAQLTEDDGFCTIRELVPGGPAMKSKKLKPNDRIIAVAQGDKPPVDVVNMELQKVVQMIRGVKNTEVRLTISPVENRSATRVISLIREEIKLEDKEARAQIIEYPGGHRVGVIELPSFYAPIGNETTPKYTSVDVKRLLARLKREKVEGVILDLRGNPGGSLEESVRLTGLFIKEGPVVLARDAEGKVIVNGDPDPEQFYDGPLVVMLNRFSASASEIVGAALQDYGRAVIVGDISTHGKGTVQQLQPLRPLVWPATASATNDPGTLKITKGKFYRVSGASTQLRGVASDIVLPDVLNHSTQIGEAGLDNPMPWDTIKPVRYSKLNLVEPFLSELQARSSARTSTNQEYLYIKEDIEQFKKNQAEKSASLNEREVIAERQRIAAQNFARERERQARALPGVKIYELTLKHCEDDLLPEPKSWFATNTVTVDYRPDADLKAWLATNAVDPKLGTDWPERTAFYTITNTLTGEATNYFSQLELPETDEKATNAPVRQRVITTLSKSVPQDPMLDEGANILRDYIELLIRSGSLSNNR